MYDLSFFRNNLDAIAKRLSDRGFSLDVDEFRKLDTERRAALNEAQQLMAQKNAETQEIGKLRKAGEDTTERQQKSAAMSERITALEQQASTLDESFRQLMAGIPNTPHESVPTGKGEGDNVEIKKWGEPTKFSFEPKPHWELGPELGILD